MTSAFFSNDDKLQQQEENTIVNLELPSEFGLEEWFDIDETVKCILKHDYKKVLLLGWIYVAHSTILAHQSI